VIPDRDVWAAAALMVKRYGDDALLDSAVALAAARGACDAIELCRATLARPTVHCWMA
jgi:hypothetical protein